RPLPRPEAERARPVRQEIHQAAPPDGRADQVAADADTVRGPEPLGLRVLDQLAVPGLEGMEAARHSVDHPLADRRRLNVPEPDHELVADVADRQEIDDPRARNPEPGTDVDAVLAADGEGLVSPGVQGRDEGVLPHGASLLRPLFPAPGIARS